MFNRLPPAVPPPPLLATAHGIKLELMRCHDDDGSMETLVSYEVHGVLDDEDSDLVAALLSQFRTGGKSEAGHD
jgi:hypothetical protein